MFENSPHGKTARPPESNVFTGLHRHPMSNFCPFHTVQFLVCLSAGVPTGLQVVQLWSVGEWERALARVPFGFVLGDRDRVWELRWGDWRNT